MVPFWDSIPGQLGEFELRGYPSLISLFLDMFWFIYLRYFSCHQARNYAGGSEYSAFAQSSCRLREDGQVRVVQLQGLRGKEDAEVTWLLVGRKPEKATCGYVGKTNRGTRAPSCPEPSVLRDIGVCLGDPCPGNAHLDADMEMLQFSELPLRRIYLLGIH